MLCSYCIQPMSSEAVFLHHGLWGRSGDLINVATQLKEKHGCDYYLLSCNVGKTAQGIVSCGTRCLAAIREVTDSLAPGTLVSFFGHSLGGLILLQALKILSEESPTYFKDKGLVCETVFLACSPLLGLTDSVWPIVRWAAEKLEGRTFDDLLFKTDDLEQLCSEPLMDLLRGFTRLILFGNVIDDPAVSAASSLLLQDNASAIPDFDTLFIKLTDNPRPGSPSEGIAGRIRVKWRKLPWQRYAFKIEREWFDFVGNAHNKIVMHARRDIFSRGTANVAQIVNVWKST